MGMFDTIRAIGESAIRFKCAAGHVQLDLEFQTKDFECVMDNYLIFEDKLWVFKKNERSSQPDIRAGILRLTSYNCFEAESFTGEVHMYRNCDFCDPVIYEQHSEASARWDMISESYPWVEYGVEFASGIVKQVTPIKLETRDDVRKQHTGALPDDDRIAKKHLANLRKRDR